MGDSSTNDIAICCSGMDLTVYGLSTAVWGGREVASCPGEGA